MENIKICFISDTHGTHKEIDLEPVDLLIHTGDFSTSIKLSKQEDFLSWFATRNARAKILVAGNHDKVCVKYNKEFRLACKKKNIIYLENSAFEYRGIKIWGTPNASYHLIGAAFDTPEKKELNRYIALIPENTDILLSHVPPDCINGFEEEYRKQENLLLKKLEIIKPVYHAFGHVHKQNSISRFGDTTLINSCVVNNKEEYIGIPRYIMWENK